MRHALVVLVALSSALGTAADEADKGAQGEVKSVTAAAIPGSLAHVPLCRAVAPEALADTASKEDVAAIRKACEEMVNAVNRSVQIENTIIWMGMWQPGNPGGRAGYTNRLDVVELKRRVGALTAELEAHIAQVQKVIRSQGDPAR
jgi:hypothetical protein